MQPLSDVFPSWHCLLSCSPTPGSSSHTSPLGLPSLKLLLPAAGLGVSAPCLLAFRCSKLSDANSFLMNI